MTELEIPIKDFVWASIIYRFQGGTGAYFQARQKWNEHRGQSNLDKEKIKDIFITFLNRWHTRVSLVSKNKDGVEVENKLPDLWQCVRDIFSSVKGRTLQDLVPGADDVWVLKCFKELRGLKVKTKGSRSRGLGPTGSSKILHLIAPACFAMWDGPIRERFGYGLGGADDYVRFLWSCKRRMEELNEGFGSTVWGSTKNFLKKMGEEFGDQENVTELGGLDEYYWITTTYRSAWDGTREARSYDVLTGEWAKRQCLQTVVKFGQLKEVEGHAKP